MNGLLEPIGELTEQQETEWATKFPDLYKQALDDGSYDEDTNQLYSTDFLPDFLQGLFKDPEIIIPGSNETHGQ